MVSASDRDPFASDLGPSTFDSRALSPRVSFPGLRRPISARTLSGSCADVVRVDPELGGSCGDASVLPAAGENLCGAVVALRICLGPTRCWRNIYLWCLKYFLWCLLLTRVVPLGLLFPHGLAFFGPCLPARSDYWLLELG